MPTLCPAVVHETVCVEAEVKIRPCVDVGEIQSFCKGPPEIGNCEGPIREDCTFKVRQRICVQIPLDFSAKACAEPTGIVCGVPRTGPCDEEPPVDGCTRTHGFFAQNTEVTEALINSAPNGQIILGQGSQGASFTVTAENFSTVFSNNIPSPPAPANPPFRGQYDILYSQLLAANLNVLNGATCPAAVTAIANANEFLATSPAGVGKEGAPAVQEPLAEFNEGKAEGCPEHCPPD